MAAVLWAALVLASAGCGPARHDVANVAVEDAAAMQQEYRQEIGRIHWPPQSTAPPRAAQGETSTNYEIGVGAASADFAWMCAWSREWLTARSTDRERADRALAELSTASQLPVWSSWDADGHDLLNKAVAAARGGDAGPMETLSAALSCTGAVSP
jgi:hypothetical protein